MDMDAFVKQAAELVSDVIDQHCGDKCGNDPTRSAVGDDLDDGADDIPLSDLSGNRKSLFIGINYYGSSAELRGCINDVKNIKQFVVDTFGFPTDSRHMRILTDDDPSNMPTRSNMIKAMKWLVNGAKNGDSLFLHYSGHGGSVKDTDGDEMDGMDETLIPVDYKSAGHIVDDDLHALLVAGLPAGVRLTAVMDCCHSGSVLDLPYTYAPDGNLEIIEIDNRKQIIEASIKAGLSLLNGNKRDALQSGMQAASLFAQSKTGNGTVNEEAKRKQREIRTAMADVIQFSGCRDNQTSADGKCPSNDALVDTQQLRKLRLTHKSCSSFVQPALVVRRPAPCPGLCVKLTKREAVSSRTWNCWETFASSCMENTPRFRKCRRVTVWT